MTSYLQIFLHLVMLTGFAKAQSEATGDLSRNAPYGIPGDSFENTTSNPIINTTVPIAGYDVSVPAGQDSSNGSAISGWQLVAAVAPDVSLSDATENVDKGKFTEATTLSILPPEGGITFDPSWKICATVYTGLDGVDKAVATMDGTCQNLLPSDCIKQLVVDAQSRGIQADGSCSTPGIPEKCKGHFKEGTNGTAFALDEAIISANRFYAFCGPPTDPGNKTAIEEAEGNIWPVIFAWAHLASNGQIHASNANAACVKAGNKPGTGTGGGGGTGTTSPTPTPSAGLIASLIPNLQLILALVGSVMLLML